MGDGIETHISLQMVQISEVFHKTSGRGTESGRQLHVDIGKLDTLQVAVDGTIDRQRLIRPPLAEVWGQIAHEKHQVGLTQLGFETHAHRLGAERVGQRQGQVEVDQYVGSGRLQAECRQPQLAVIHRDRACQPGNLHATFFFQGKLAHHQPQRRVVEVDAVNAHSDVSKVKVVEVQSFHTGLEILVILNGTIHQVNRLHGIGLRVKVDQCL